MVNSFLSSFFTDGPWKTTGDIGQWTPATGTLRFLDRISASVRLDGLRLLHLGRLSALYSRNEWVQQIFVFRNRTSGVLSAVVVPDLLALTNYAADLQANFEGMMDGPTDPASLIAHSGVKKMVLQSLDNSRTELGLEEWERIEDLRFQIDAFSIENNFLTVTLKQRREQLQRDFNN